MATQPYSDDEWETIEAPATRKAPIATSAADEWETVTAPTAATGVEKPAQRSFGTRFKDEYTAATQTGFPGLVARKLYDWADIGMDDLKKKFPGRSDDWYEQTHEQAVAQTQKDILAEADAKAKDDPSWRPDETWIENLASGRWLATIGGMGGGSAGPEMLIAPGGTAGARVLAQGGIGAASDLGYQGLEVADNVRDDISLEQAAASGLFNMGAQGVGEALGKLVGKYSGRGKTFEEMKAENPTVPDEEIQAAVDYYNSGGTEEVTINNKKINDYYRDKYGIELDRPEPEQMIKVYRSGGGGDGGWYTTSKSYAEQLAARDGRKVYEGEIPRSDPLFLDADELDIQAGRTYQRDFAPGEVKNVKELGKTSEEIIPKNMQKVVDHANELTTSWKNSPEIEVNPHFDDIDGIDPNSLGIYDAESGKVYLNTKAIENEAKFRKITPQEMTNTVLFHEGLGHFGLAQKFRDDLDFTLDNIYESSPYLRKEVNKWLERNPDGYSDLTPGERQTRAAEEVLAEMSEKGRVPASYMNKIKNKIKEYARELGIELQFSEREIRTILDQAHAAVVNGKKADVIGNGFKTMMRDGDNKEAVQKAIDDTARMFGITNVEKALREPDFRSQVKMTLEQAGIPQSYLDRTPYRPMKASVSDLHEKRLDTYKKLINSSDIVKLNEAIDYLDEAYAQGRTEVADLQDSLMDRLKKVEDSRTSSNDNKPETPREAIRRLAEKADERAIEVSFNDERRFANKNSKAYKAWLAESDKLEAQRDALWEQYQTVNSDGTPFKSSRPMKASGTGSEGQLQGGTRSEQPDGPGIGRIRSNRQLDEIMEENAPTRTEETWKEWIDEAGKIKMTGKAAQNLAKGTDVPELLAAEEFAVKSANRIFDLSRKASLTPRERFILGQEQERLSNILQSVADIKANAGRILNASKIEVGTDKAMTDAVRRMLATADLTTPEGRAAATAIVEKAEVSAKKKAQLNKLKDVVANLANLPFSLMSTLDLSAPFRQGRSLVHTKAFWKSVLPMFSMAGKSENFRAVMKSIQERPTFKLMEDSGLFLADMGKQLNKREERFMSSWASKIPGIGRAVRFSERGYVGFLNKLRADTFDDLLSKMDKVDPTFRADEDRMKGLASFVNNATGRGDIKSLTEAGPVINGLFFSPRLLASRLQLLNPVYYATLPKGVRAEAVKSLLATGGLTATVGVLATMMGATVETDPRSSDFMKIKTGDTRYDTLGGFGQYVTLGARIASNQTKNSKKDIVELGKKFGSDTRWDVAMDFLSNKFSPLASLVKDWMKGKDFEGKDFDAKKEIIKRFIPLFAQDVLDGIDQEGAVGAAKAAPSFFGIGSQTYPSPKGTDVLGRSYEAEREDTLASTEIARLEELIGKTVVNPPKKKVGDRELTEEEFLAYQKLAGEWITQSLEEEMQTPEWATYSDEEKVDIIRDIAKDMRANAREELFSDEDEDIEDELWEDVE